MFDADRLTLWRVGTVPDPKKLATAAAITLIGPAFNQVSGPDGSWRDLVTEYEWYSRAGNSRTVPLESRPIATPLDRSKELIAKLTLIAPDGSERSTTADDETLRAEDPILFRIVCRMRPGSRRVIRMRKKESKALASALRIERLS